MPTEESPTLPKCRFDAETTLVGAAVLLLLLPWLLVSSPDYRELTLQVFGIAAVCLAWCISGLRAVICEPLVRWPIACIIVAHAASLVGGLHHGEKLGNAGFEFVTGTSGILGMGALTWVLLRPRWRVGAWRTFLGLTVLLVVASLLGFLVFNQWHVDLTRHTPHMDIRRLSLVWAPRLLSGELGWQFWAHSNTAAFLFAAAWAVLADALFPQPRHAAAGWFLALLLAFAVFLTASRSAWVMVILALPPLLAFRPWGYAMKVGALLAISGILGMATVMERAKTASGSQTTPPADGSATIHLGALVERGSAGRSAAYQILWNDLEDHRWFGKGLAVTREPVAHLLHEHSTYMATLRGGGIIALAAHGMLLACAFRAAILLFRNGCRWPLLLAITVFSGLLFDRSTVFKLSGFDEFPMHWLAVWIPIARWSREKNQTSILRKRNEPQTHADGHGFSETSEKISAAPRE